MANPVIIPGGGMYGGPEINGSSPSALINAGFAYGGQSGAQQVSGSLDNLLSGLVAPQAGATVQSGLDTSGAANAALSSSNAAASIVNQAAEIASKDAYYKALVAGDSAKLAEQKAEFAANLAIAQATQQLAQQNQAFQQQLASQNQQFTQGMDVAKLAGSLTGPANAFVQQATLHGLNQMGLSRAVDSLTGGATPLFQAPQATPIPLNMSTLLQLITNPNATPVNPSTPYQFQGQAVQPTTVLGGGGSWAGSTASNFTPAQQQAFNTLTANNGSPAAGVTAGQFQAYLNANGNVPPTDANSLATWVAANPGQTATSSTIAAPAAGGATGTPAAAPSPYADPALQAQARQLMGNAVDYMPGTIFTPADIQASGGYANHKTNGFNEFGGVDPLTQGGWVAASNSANGVSTPAGYGSVPDYLKALPAPNQIVSRDWHKLDPDTQDFLLSGYGEKGYSRNDILHAVGSTLPQFAAPAAGQIAA